MLASSPEQSPPPLKVLLDTAVIRSPNLSTSNHMVPLTCFHLLLVPVFSIPFALTPVERLVTRHSPKEEKVILSLPASASVRIREAFTKKESEMEGAKHTKTLPGCYCNTVGLAWALFSSHLLAFHSSKTVWTHGFASHVSRELLAPCPFPHKCFGKEKAQQRLL